MLKSHKIVVQHGFETSFGLDTENNVKVFDIQGVDIQGVQGEKHSVR
jgi:hypothetical protein